MYTKDEPFAGSHAGYSFYVDKKLAHREQAIINRLAELRDAATETIEVEISSQAFSKL